MKKKIILLITMLFLFISLMQASEQVTEQPAEKIADFTLEDAEGNQVNLYETLQKGDAVIIDFWATWCMLCCKALPHLNNFHEKYDNVHVIIISEDSKGRMKKADAYIKSRGYTVTSLFDPTGEVKKLLGAEVLPETFYVKPDGEIFFRHRGYKKGAEIEMEEKLKEMLETLPKKEIKETTEETN